MDRPASFLTPADTPARRAGLWLDVQQTSPMPVRGALACAPGELLAVVGPSGAGKTSLLRILAGLMRPQSGRVTVGGQVWCDTASGVFLPPRHRHVGLVFQHYALMPHLSALDNVALALLHLPAPRRREQAAQWLLRVRLGPELHGRRPAQLSGGQQQRVAVARALAREPRLLLLDEPFSAVDQMSRQGLYTLLADLRRELHIPIVLVTHDLSEARLLADTLVVMDGGQVLQQGSPAQLYRAPRNARVADLVGLQNRFHGRWLGPDPAEPGMGWLGWLPRAGEPGEPAVRLRVRDKGRLDPQQQVTWVIQSDGLHLLDDPTQRAGQSTLCAHLTELRYLGELSLATLALDDLPGVSLQLTLAGPQRLGLTVGQKLCVRLDLDWVHVMPTRNAQ
jgi:molybdate transport system ATP-binding protein